jgi:tetratricopeptide (TPR) repeat protein
LDVLSKWEIVVHPSRNGMLIGMVLVLCASFAYLLLGFHWPIWFEWLAGIVVCAVALYPYRVKEAIKINRVDVFATLLLFLGALPGFVRSIYTVPFQVNADEAAALLTERVWLFRGYNDLFGLSDYFGFTFCHFLVQGWLAKLLGGVDLYHLRLVHGLDGALIVAAAFVFFRVLGLNRLMAITATVFIGANHSLIGLSRMAFTINFPLFIELIALCFLFQGLKHRCLFTTYIGGVCMGLGFYVYYPGRVVLPIWLMLLAELYLFRPRLLSRKELINVAVASAIGLVLALAPLAVACFKQAPQFRDSLDFQRHQCLLFPEGREMANHWAGSKSVPYGILRNILNGVTVFNNTVEDNGYEYENRDHGFVDPLSGVLLWIGFIRVAFLLSGRLAPTMMISGLLLQMFFFSFIVTKAPNYTRLLVVLPFAGYFVAYGLDMFATMARNVCRTKRRRQGQVLSYLIFAAGNLAIVAWNFSIYHDFAKFGLTHGDPIGGTGRYIEARKNQPNYLFVTSANVAEFPYYNWEVGTSWNSRMLSFLSGKQQCRELAPDELTSLRLEPPFTIFMSGKLWKLKGDKLRQMYPHLVLHPIYEDTGLIAVEDCRITKDSARVHQGYCHLREYMDKVEDLMKVGDYAGATALCVHVLNAPQEVALGTDDKYNLLLYLGIAYTRQKNYPQAEAALLKGLKTCEGMTGKHDDQVVPFTRALGQLYMEWQRWADAQIYWNELVEAYESDQDSLSYGWMPTAAEACRYRGLALWHMGKYDEAIQVLQHALDYYKNHPERTNVDADDIARELEGCRKEKEEVARQKVAAAAPKAPDEHTNPQPQQALLTAKAPAAKAAVSKLAAGDADDDLARLYARLGLACQDRGKYLQAETAYRQALACMDGSQYPNNEMAETYAQLGHVYLQLARYTDAEKSFATAISLCSTDCNKRVYYQRDRDYALHCQQHPVQASP